MFMKNRILKIAVPLFLAVVLVVAGVYPITAQGAAKGTTYDVTLLTGSATVSLASVNDGAAVPQQSNLDGATFQLIVGSKLLKDKKSGATYYEVILPKKSFKSPTAEFPMIGGGGTAVKSSYLKKDGKGKLYVSGGDVDYSVVQGEKKAVYKWGDGTVDPEGSMVITVDQVSALGLKGQNKVLSNVIQTLNLTTGTCSIKIQNTKGQISGKGLPADDTTKKIPIPYKGAAINLQAGTGTLVSCSAAMNGKNKMVNGTVDNATAQYWIMSLR